ncbi:hypothetical protein O181_022608 [Austropuccinia psidii MF-1]|uniref:Tet-like 2OG-Fe(II) oxygenase domain-containing protein n=1 Tax=Austropuccinia psidii MF-1 TaxID=1389203 RepID=A0A9Q3CH77_9BASI|nr:hypothetical protein [Austropuccinia psidii MF-1]
MWAPTGKSWMCADQWALALGAILDSKGLDSHGSLKYVISFLFQHKVIPQQSGNSGMSRKTYEGKTAQRNKFFSSSQPTAQISMPVLANITTRDSRRIVDLTQIKRIHFGHVATFSLTGLLIALVEFRPFTTMSDIEFNQWDELSKGLFCKRKFRDPIATDGVLMEGFMFAIGWCKCSTKNKKFGIYRSLGRIEDAKDEWQNRGANLSSVGGILAQPLQYLGDILFQKVQTCYMSLGVPSFDQINYEANVSENQGAFEFSSTLTFTMNGFKKSPHLDKECLTVFFGMVVSS